MPETILYTIAAFHFIFILLMVNSYHLLYKEMLPDSFNKLVTVSELKQKSKKQLDFFGGFYAISTILIFFLSWVCYDFITGLKAGGITLISGAMIGAFFDALLDEFTEKKIKEKKLQNKSRFKELSLDKILFEKIERYKKFEKLQKKYNKVIYRLFDDDSFKISSIEKSDIFMETHFTDNYISLSSFLLSNEREKIPLATENILYSEIKSHSKFSFIKAKIDEFHINFSFYEESMREQTKKDQEELELLQRKNLEKLEIETAKAQELNEKKAKDKEKKEQIIKNAKVLIESESFQRELVASQLKENINLSVDKISLEDELLKKNLKEKLYQKEMTRI